MRCPPFFVGGKGQYSGNVTEYTVGLFRYEEGLVRAVMKKDEKPDHEQSSRDR
jgi:hypothetical protein